MKNLLIIGAVLAIVLGGFAFARQQKTETTTQTSMTDENTVTVPTEASEKDSNMEETVQTTSVKYAEFSEDTLAETQDKRQVLFFHADWCPTCRTANNEFIDNQNEIPDDVVILKADYDTETVLKDEYGVTYQHTFVQIDDEGNKLTSWNGGDIANLQRNLVSE